jgi:hypothetical protein
VSGVRRAFLLGAALAMAAPAHAGERDCAGLAFDDMRLIRFGKVAAPVNFVANGAKDPACPSAEARCRDKAQVARGDLLALGVTLGEHVCAEKVKGVAHAGWLPAQNLDKSPRVNDAGAFVGAWRRGAAEIRIAWLEDGRLTVEGRAGNGAFSGDMDLRDGVAIFDGEGVDSENRASPGCRVRMARGGDVLVARDNGQCGGGFGGTFIRTNAPPSAKKD